jgi:hypothetical protein
MASESTIRHIEHLHSRGGPSKSPIVTRVTNRTYYHRAVSRNAPCCTLITVMRPKPSNRGSLRPRNGRQQRQYPRACQRLQPIVCPVLHRSSSFSRVSATRPLQRTAIPIITHFFGDCHALRPRVNALRPRVNALRPRVNALRTRVNALRPRVNALRTRVNALCPRVNALRTRVNALRGCSKIESAVGYTQPDETPKPSHHA